jgi:hypothetical protein
MNFGRATVSNSDGFVLSGDASAITIPRNLGAPSVADVLGNEDLLTKPRGFFADQFEVSCSDAGSRSVQFS